MKQNAANNSRPVINVFGPGSRGGLEKQRVNLCRLVLCSFRPLSYSALTDALRISFDDKNVYDESLTEDQVSQLGADFLVPL
jgi:hypothetical protein